MAFRAANNDLHTVLLTGAAGWRDAGSHYTRAELATVATLVSFTAAVVSVLLVSAGLPGEHAAVHGGARWAIAAAGSVTLLAGVSPNLVWLINRLPEPVGSQLVHAALGHSDAQPPIGDRQSIATPVLHAAFRLAALGVVTGAWTALLGPASPWPAWLLGGVIACEYTLTAWAIGVHMNGLQWWWRIERSALHIGVVLLVGAAALLNPSRLSEMVLLLVTFQFVVLGGAITCHMLERLRRSFEYRQHRTMRRASEGAWDEINRWLHNTVVTELKLMRRHVQSSEAEPETLQLELEALIHALYLKQLDGQIDLGEAGLADVTSPFIRLCQSQEVDVDVTAIPPPDELNLELDPDDWKQLMHALGVLVPNAIQAGASLVTLRAEPLGADCLLLEVEDDACGFSLADAPPGRALDRLQRELGDAGLTQEPTSQGTCLRVAVGKGVNGAAPTSSQKGAPP